MKNKTNQEIVDIEGLLLSKSYDSLSNEERIFVKKEINSAQEYEELRATLLSVKQWAKEENQLVAKEKVKMALMKQMEAKANQLSIWDKLGAILFPINVPLHKKPGFQFAVMGVVLLLVINLGLNQFGNRQNEVAMNSETKVKPAQLPELIVPSKEQPKKVNSPMPVESVSSPEKEETQLLEIVEEDAIEEEFLSEIEQSEKAVKSNELISPSITNYTEAVTLESNQTDASNKSLARLTQSDFFVEEKPKKKSNSSQNLASQAELIDLLFTTL